jgi:hypothetical protein
MVAFSHHSGEKSFSFLSAFITHYWGVMHFDEMLYGTCSPHSFKFG